MIVGCRVPLTYFVTSGTGQSDITVHAGSYHLALRQAGIEQANIITYSSILPAKLKRTGFVRVPHGCVMETISAEASCASGERATAGLIFGWLYDKATDEKYGGLVCEYSGSLSEWDAETEMRLMLDELHENGYEHLRLDDIEVWTATIRPHKRHGTAVVAICFTSYEWPEVDGA